MTLTRHVFVIGSKSIGQYGGYETFVDKLIEQHQDDPSIKYHIACKANGDGSMDETKLNGVEEIKKDHEGKVTEFTYKNAHVYKIQCPQIGSAVAIYYDCAALRYAIDYSRKNHIKDPVFYVLTCRIGLFISALVKQIKRVGGTYVVNPDGHEWMRAKWSIPVRRYWKWSEKRMVTIADVVVCDSINIQDYIRKEYKHPSTTYIAYGADIAPSIIADNNPIFLSWIRKNNLRVGDYYLVVGRFVPENNYEIMIREFMQSRTDRDLAIITNDNEAYLAKLEKRLHWKKDKRIKFVGTVYDKELLKKIREKAYAYIHGHEVGGTNPSLLEAMGSTQLSLLLDVGFNREVGQEAAMYWTKEKGMLAELIEKVEKMQPEEIEVYAHASKERILRAYSWKRIGDKYKTLWMNRID